MAANFPPRRAAQHFGSPGGRLRETQSRGKVSLLAAPEIASSKLESEWANAVITCW
jgi:hypothetical protein